MGIGKDDSHNRHEPYIYVHRHWGKKNKLSLFLLSPCQGAHARNESRRYVHTYMAFSHQEKSPHQYVRVYSSFFFFPNVSASAERAERLDKPKKKKKEKEKEKEKKLPVSRCGIFCQYLARAGLGTYVAGGFLQQ